MKTSDFYYDLPEELIAQHPLEDRSSSRLMVLDKTSGKTLDMHFKDLPSLLRKGDVLVINNTRVIPARLIGARKDTGSPVEILLLKRIDEKRWECIVRPGKTPEVIEFPEGYKELQRLVEGNFEMPYLFDDVDIVVNEEGKFNGSDPNRLLYYKGQLIDILFGNILIVDANDEGETISLSEDKISKYMKIFSNEAIFLA